MVEDLREACRVRLLADTVRRDWQLLAESVAELLVTYARHPADAEDILAAIDAVLGAGGCARCSDYGRFPGASTWRDCWLN